MALTIKWDITYQCNLMCEHCINGKFLNQIENELDYSAVCKVVDNISSYLPIGYIHFLGGEPLVRNDFINIAQYLNDKHIAFGFNTNGLLLSEEVIKKICALEKMDTIVLSLEGPNAKINDEIRGKNVFHMITKRLKTLQNYKKEHSTCNTSVIVNCVAMKTNYKSIPELIKVCVDYGVNSINILEFIEGGNGEGKHLSLSKSEILELLHEVALSYQKYGEQIQIVPKFARPITKDFMKKCFELDFPEIEQGCGAGTDFAFLDNVGNIYPCDREREHLKRKYNLVYENFKDVWESGEFEKPFKSYYNKNTYSSLKPCNHCKHLQVDCFPCHIDLRRNNANCISYCASLEESAKEKGVTLFNLEPILKIEDYCRITDSGTDKIVYNTQSSSIMKFDDKSYTIFDYIKQNSPNRSLVYEKGAQINVNHIDIDKFLDVLEKEGFICVNANE